MRNVVAVLLAALLTGTAFAQAPSCARLTLETPQQKADLAAAIAEFDADALRVAQLGVKCFAKDEFGELAQANGAYFEARPREYLKIISAGSMDGMVLLEALVYAPEPVRQNARAYLELLTHRGALLQANADSLPVEIFDYVIAIFWQVIDERVTTVAKPLAVPTTLIDPLTGMEVDLRRGIRNPTPSDYMSFADIARMADFYMAANVWAAGQKSYVILSGFAFEWAAGGAAPTGLVPVPAWIEVVDESKPGASIEVLGPVNQVLASGRIPPEIADALCDSGVKQLLYRFDADEQRLQAALDAHIAAHPEASLAAPVRKAFKRAGFNVRRFRELPTVKP